MKEKIHYEGFKEAKKEKMTPKKEGMRILLKTQTENIHRIGMAIDIALEKYSKEIESDARDKELHLFAEHIKNKRNKK